MEQRSMYIEQVLNEMKRLGTPDVQQFIPCTEEEVLLLEQQLHLSLPTAYKEFLLTMGKGSADFLVGSEFLYQDLPGLQEVAREMLVEDAFPQAFPEDGFVFFMHQGYQFNFFRTSEEANPPIYRYYEGKDQQTFPLIYPHYTDFLLTELRDHAAYIQRRKKR
jgi:hypothetical protein